MSPLPLWPSTNLISVPTFIVYRYNRSSVWFISFSFSDKTSSMHSPALTRATSNLASAALAHRTAAFSPVIFSREKQWKRDTDKEKERKNKGKGIDKNSFPSLGFSLSSLFSVFTFFVDPFISSFSSFHLLLSLFSFIPALALSLSLSVFLLLSFSLFFSFAFLFWGI